MRGKKASIYVALFVLLTFVLCGVALGKFLFDSSKIKESIDVTPIQILKYNEKRTDFAIERYSKYALARALTNVSKEKSYIDSSCSSSGEESVFCSLNPELSKRIEERFKENFYYNFGEVIVSTPEYNVKASFSDFNMDFTGLLEANSNKLAVSYPFIIKKDTVFFPFGFANFQDIFDSSNRCMEEAKEIAKNNGVPVYEKDIQDCLIRDEKLINFDVIVSKYQPKLFLYELTTKKYFAPDFKPIELRYLISED